MHVEKHCKKADEQRVLKCDTKNSSKDQCSMWQTRSHSYFNISTDIVVLFGILYLAFFLVGFILCCLKNCQLSK